MPQRKSLNRAFGKEIDMTKKTLYLHASDKIFLIFVYTLLSVVFILTIYPLIFVLSASFSSGQAIFSGKVLLWPVNPSIEGYLAVFRTGDVFVGFRNSIFYTVAGTAINIILTLLAAYPLSRRVLIGKNFLLLLFSFTMIFSAGMIPNFILMMQLGLIDTVWALLLPGALSVYNMIIVRTYFSSNLPYEMYEAAIIDGSTEFQFFLRIAVPLAKPAIAVVALFYSIGHWNNYFNAFLYISLEELFPLQIVLRNILITQRIDVETLISVNALVDKNYLAEVMKYSLIVIATIPMMLLYPFAQKYFVKGMIVGSLKG